MRPCNSNCTERGQRQVLQQIPLAFSKLFVSVSTQFLKRLPPMILLCAAYRRMRNNFTPGGTVMTNLSSVRSMEAGRIGFFTNPSKFWIPLFLIPPSLVSLQFPQALSHTACRNFSFGQPCYQNSSLSKFVSKLSPILPEKKLSLNGNYVFKFFARSVETVSKVLPDQSLTLRLQGQKQKESYLCTGEERF